MTGFDSIQVKFENLINIESTLTNTKVVPFVGSYFDILKAVVDDVETEHFWFFSNFVDLGTVDLNFIPQKHERDQLHVWYTTHPMGGLNKEGNVMLVPTKQFKKQMHDIEFLRDFKDINYHPSPVLYQHPIPRTTFKLRDPRDSYFKEGSTGHIYQWMVNNDLANSVPAFKFPDFYPSMWEDVMMYTWGETKDIILVPLKDDVKQFLDIDSSINFDLEYPVKPMEVLELKSNSKLGFINAATSSKTEYFFALLPGKKIKNNKVLDYQPDRLSKPCHYVFDDELYLCNKKLVLDPKNAGLDVKLAVKVNDDGI